MAIKIEANEKDIEDILCRHMDEFLGLRYVGRQINTPAGVVDILAKSPEKRVFYIIELKRGEINASAYAQVMRYCHYFNYNKTRCGRRIFAPLLIGDHLAGEMQKNVKIYEQNGEGYSPSCPVPEYTLFQFNPLSGISFSYQSPTQVAYADEHFYKQENYIQALHEGLAYNEHRRKAEIKSIKDQLS